MPKITYIRSNSDIFQRLETLKRNRYKRHREGRFIVEGVKPINLAIANSWDITGLVYSSAKPLSFWGEQVLARCPQATRYILSAELMDALSDREEPSEIIAEVSFRDEKRADELRLTHGKPPLIVVFDRPQSPGNLGTVIRSCSCFGADALIVCGHCADIYDPQTVRSSIGALFALPVVRAEGFAEVAAFADRLRRDWPGLRMIGTSAHASAPIGEIKLSGPLMLALGNETDGLSRLFREGCDEMAIIPIGGAASSLNVGCAASICLYEISRQRGGILKSG